MKRLLFPAIVVLFLSMFLSACGNHAGLTSQAALASGDGDSSQQSPPFKNGEQKSGLTAGAVLPPIRLKAGTPIAISLQTSLSSATAAPGETFDAVLDQPLVSDGETLAPEGTPVTGKVVAARSGGRLHKPGYLRLTLTSMTLHGKHVPIETSSILLQAASHEKRNLALIGGGAGAGALIGAIAGGGKGALIGSAIGAGAGTGGAYATGKKDVGVRAERRLTFRLAHDVSVSS